MNYYIILWTLYNTYLHRFEFSFKVDLNPIIKVRAIPLFPANTVMWKVNEDDCYSVQIADIPCYVPVMRPDLDIGNFSLIPIP